MSTRSNSAASRSLASAITAVSDIASRAGSEGRKHIKLQVKRAKEADKAVLGPALAAALHLDGVSQGVLAIATGVNQSQVSYWHGSDKQDAPSLLHAQRAHAAGLVHWARAAGFYAPPPVVDEPEAVRTARIVKELLDVPAIVTANLADGKGRDGYERAQERKELLEARAAIDARLALLDHEDAQAKREREGLVKR